MRCYLNELQWQQDLAGIPAALKPKHLASLEKRWEVYGVRAVSFGNLMVVVDISKSNPDYLRRWFNEAHVILVDVEPSDVRALMGGKSLTSLTLLDCLQTDPAAIAAVTGIEPDDITDALQEIAQRAIQAAPLNKGVDPKVSLQRIKDAGVEIDLREDPYSWLDEPANTPVYEPSTANDLEFGISQGEPDLFEIAENPNGGLGGFLE